MKRILAMVLAMVMLCTASAALAEDEITLWEKIGLQMTDGSGMKGSLKLNATGEAEWAKTLAALTGGDYQLRAIRSGDGFVCELYAADGDAKKAVSKVYLTDGKAELTSELLPGVPLTLALDGAVLEAVFGDSKADNPTWYSAAMKLLGVDDAVWSEKWEAVLAPYYTDIEVWMVSYSAAPVVQEENGETVLKIRYEIPADAVGQQMLALLTKAVSDNALMTLLQENLTEEQLQTYFAADRLYHYENVLKALPLEGSILLERKVTTLGVDLESRVTLPLTANDGGWETLTIQDTNGAYVLTAVSDLKTVTLAYEKTEDQTVISWKNIPAVPSADAQAASWKMTVAKTVETRTDADTRAHEISTWHINLAQDLSHLEANDAARAFYAPVDAIDGTVTLHLSSKNAHHNPTTATLDINAGIGTNTLTVNAEIKTSSPWIVEAWTPVEGEEITAVDDARRTELWDAFTNHAVQTLTGK